MPLVVDNSIGLTDALVKNKYENNSNTNAFTDAEKAKLADLQADEVTVAASPSNYTPDDTTVEGHLSGIDTALMAVAAGAPSFNQQLAVTASNIAIVGISASSSVVLHFRNGILQNSSQYTVGSNTITPSAGAGSYDAEDLITIFWP